MLPKRSHYAYTYRKTLSPLPLMNPPHNLITFGITMSLPEGNLGGLDIGMG